MKQLDAVMVCEGVIEADDEDHIIAAWQHIIDNGTAWELQGWFGRQATNLIEGGICTPTPVH